MTDLTREGKKWTKEEINMLEEMVGTYSFTKIAKRLKRSPTAVERKLTRLGSVSTRMNGGWLSANIVAKALKLDNKVLTRWVDKYDFPMKPKNLRYTTSTYKSWHITVDDFWKWASNHKDVVNWTRYEPESLLPEPDWLRGVVKEQYQTIAKNSRRVWTPEEARRAYNLFYQGFTQKEIGEMLGRSTKAVEKKLKMLREAKVRGEKLPWEK